jgi:hypothetical protein
MLEALKRAGSHHLLMSKAFWSQPFTISNLSALFSTGTTRTPDKYAEYLDEDRRK